MKAPTYVLLFLILFSFCCNAQSGWTNYNTSNSLLLENRVSSIALDHENNLWGAYAGAGGLGEGVVKYDGKKTWIHYNTSNSGLPNNDIRDIAIDLQGHVWFSCYNAGIVKFDGENWTRYNTSNSGIAGNDIADIEFDSNGYLWVGSYFSGVSRFDGAAWTTYNKSNAPFATSNCISDLTIDKDNNVWVGMDCSGGMAKFSSGSNTWTSYTPSNSAIPDHTVTSLLADDSRVIWASHINVNISSFNGTTWTTYNQPGEIEKFALDDMGGVWGSGYGLYKFDNNRWNKIVISATVDTTYAYTVVTGTAGTVWFSTYSGLWINRRNMAPVFEVASITKEQDFEMFKVQVKPALVPEYEQGQKVMYTLINSDEHLIKATIDEITGEITLTSVTGAIGKTSIRVIANDDQADNNIHEELIEVTITPTNTPPVFEVVPIIKEQDFETFKVQVKPAPIPEWEQQQKVSYSLVNLDDKVITAAIDAISGEITLTSIAGAYGKTSLRITANDGQAKNNIHEVILEITIKQTEEVVTGIEPVAGPEVQFFPNPVSTILFFKIKSFPNSPGVVIMNDLMGREVGKLSTNDDNQNIDVSNLPSGVYLIRLVYQNNIFEVHKVLKR